MYEQNITLIKDLIQRREPVYGILSFMEDTIASMRADMTPDSHADIYPYLEEMANSLRDLSRVAFQPH